LISNLKRRLRVFENRELRRLFEQKMDEVIGGWRKLHNEEVHNFCALSGISRMITSRRARVTVHVAQMRRRRMCIGYWWEIQSEKDH
jgi:hypothetical protein